MGDELKFIDFHQLQIENKKYIEEFSGMNFFAVVQDKLITPKLGSTILPGITRDSITMLEKRAIQSKKLKSISTS